MKTTGRNRAKHAVISEWLTRGCLMLTIVVGAYILQCSAPELSIAGSRTMVEQQVKEMDRINREAVQRIPGLPDSGQVELEAEGRVYNEHVDLKVRRYTVMPITPETVNVDGGRKSVPVEENDNEN